MTDDTKGLVSVLGDGHPEKLKEMEDYPGKLLFSDFEDPGEVGFDAGWSACYRKAIVVIARLEAENARLRAHIREQIQHVETRRQDGIEMGAVVWRIALEDVARENRAALATEAPRDLQDLRALHHQPDPCRKL